MILQQYIQEVLYRQQTCCLPRIGVFSLQHIPAQYNERMGAIEPPGELITFDATGTGDDGAFAEWIALREQLMLPIAQRKMEKYINEFESSLRTGQPFVIEGLGQLQADAAGKISFLPATVPLKREALYLQPVAGAGAPASRQRTAAPPAGAVIEKTPPPIFQGKSPSGAGTEIPGNAPAGVANTTPVNTGNEGISSTGSSQSAGTTGPLQTPVNTGSEELSSTSSSQSAGTTAPLQTPVNTGSEETLSTNINIANAPQTAGTEITPPPSSGEEEVPQEYPDYPDFPESPSRFRWWWVVLPLAAVTAGIIWWVTSGQEQPPPPPTVTPAVATATVDTMDMREDVKQADVMPAVNADSVQLQYYVVIETFHDRESAEKKYHKRKTLWGQKEVALLYRSTDSSTIMLAIPYTSLPADTSGIKEEVRTKYGGNVYLEF